MAAEDEPNRIPSPYGGAKDSGPLGPRRSPVELYAEILEVLRRRASPCRITRLSYAVGMPVDRTRRALDVLVRLGLASPSGEENAAWQLTRRGYDFLQTYARLRGFLEPVEGYVRASPTARSKRPDGPSSWSSPSPEEAE
jgi:predicted transcriptional regulator